MYLRISNLKWKINDRYSEYNPDYTHVTFTLEVDVWVNGSIDKTLAFPNSCGFMPDLESPDEFIQEGYSCLTVVTYKTYPSGFSSFSKDVSGWIKEPSALQLPAGTYDFSIRNHPHTYLTISQNGTEISNDPSPTGWEEIDWSEKDWGYEYINIDLMGEFNENTQELGDVAKDVVVKDEMAYIAKGNRGIEIIEIQNLEDSNLIGLYDTNFSSSNLFAIKIDLYDNYAFISVGDGILILDVSNPSTPQFVSFINNFIFSSGYFFIEHFKIFDDFLVVPVDNDGLYIWNISDTSTPRLIAHFSKDLRTSVVDVQNDTIFLSCLRNGLLILDISNITSPNLIGNYDCYAVNVVVNENSAYVASYAGIIFLNISNPSNITFINFFGDKFYHTLKFNENYLYGIIRDKGLEIFNGSDTEDPELIGRYYNLGKMHGIFIDENYIYLANGYSSLVILDKDFEPLEYPAPFIPPSLYSPIDSIPNFNSFYLALGMGLGAIYILSKFRKEIKRRE